MKHVYYTYLLTILMSMIGARGFAHDIEVANSDGKTIYYKISDATSVSVTYQGEYRDSYPNEYSGDIVIPETITYGSKTYSVTCIDQGAFSGCSNLTSVTVGNRVTSIGISAFSGCSSLTSVTIGNSVTSINHYTFYNCSNLTSIKWNAKNYSSSSDSEKPFFIIQTQITEFIIGDEVMSIPDYICYKMSNLKSVIIGNSVTTIGKEAFSGCSGLTSVTIPDSVTSIGSYAFRGCSSLTSVTIGNSVTSISPSTFSGCSSLTSVIWNAKNYPVSSIISSPFYSIRTQITEFVIGDKVMSIPDWICWEMSNLKSVTIGNSVTSIGCKAFHCCNGLTSVTIPNSVTSIDDSFSHCDGLISLKCMPNVPPSLYGGGTVLPNRTSFIIYVPYGCKAIYENSERWSWRNLRMLSDSNGDDVVNEIDYSGVANYIMGDTPAVFDAEASDVDVNGTVDVRDNVGIANIISTGSIYGGTSNNAKAAMSKGAAMPTTDESDAENVIYVENVSGSKNSQVELSVRMKNASDIRGFQFDLYLPEGVSMAANAKASLSSDRLAAGDAHTLMVNEVSDGAVRFLCSSMNDESFAGGDGEIATLTVNIADNVANGEYDVVVKNALMTETDISKSYEADNIKSALTVLDQTGVETVTADDERRDGTIYTVGGQLVGKKSTTSQLRKGVYIRNGKKFVVK